ncbi:MAG: glutamine-hydrolyzing carbamoyl-phosphate synthase small subunit [Brevinematales bacterium]|jgi:carbamoyl-phosphate synthase small subunit
MQKAVLLLKNGEVFRGRNFGFAGETMGEVVFNTSMTGYQEILTDPSYKGQIVTMTYPLIGNYGVNPDNMESEKIQAAGFIVREASKIASNWTSRGTIGYILEENGIVGIEGIDTRKLTRILRITGAMNGILSAVDFDTDSLKKKLSSLPDMSGLDLVPSVTIDKPARWKEFVTGRPHIVAVQTGVKHNIMRIFDSLGANITLIPAIYSDSQILNLKPDGVFLANGPGDPREVKYAINAIKGILGKIPIFGICLGHQLLGLASGAKIYKLKFGHRGANQPVMNMLTGNVEITSQNHGFSIVEDSIPPDIEITHVNLNDRTVEGLRHKKFNAFSVQYHPEASPGPHDSRYLFNDFMRIVKSY